MEREFENYNRNIEELDARNIFEYDILKELNKKKYDNSENKENLIIKKSIISKSDNKRRPAFN